MKAIVYTSNTGSTACYAKMLGQETDLPVYSAEEAKKQLPDHSEIVYLGWIMAGSIKGYKAASKHYRILAVCGVGMSRSEKQEADIRKREAIPADIPVFNLQGDYDTQKLHGIYKGMMKMMEKMVGKKIAAKTDRTSEEDEMLDMLLHGSKRVSMENMKDVLEWYDSTIQK